LRSLPNYQFCSPSHAAVTRTRFHVRHQLPPAVERLLRAADSAGQEQLWAEFLSEYSRLILHVARSQGGSYDEAMDRYAYVLERLRRDDCARLRRYAADGRGKFTTWLVVVVRRLCVDEARSRYGRYDAESRDRHGERRQLADLVAADLDLDLLPAADAQLPEADIRGRELRESLADAVASLEPCDRLLLRLRFQDEVPVAEIARIQSLPSVFHVYRRLQRIYDSLRTSLRGAGVEDAAP
jgi:RNA polymerase sigma factor (sigma-70 family)